MPTYKIDIMVAMNCARCTWSKFNENRQTIEDGASKSGYRARLIMPGSEEGRWDGSRWVYTFKLEVDRIDDEYKFKVCD